ncbi:MAG: gliding motility-associated C-terminal domain-containing protein [Bacteroidia bacterium]
MKNKLLVLLVFLGLNISAQTVELFNNGDTIYINNDVIYVNGGITNTSNGVFDNYGQIYLTENWTNNAGNVAFSNASNGEVILTGANQNIQGNNITEFYTLSLQGTGIKYLNAVDAIVKNQLNLNDIELATQTNTIYIKNTSLNAIQRTSGFVSSLGSGSLSRDMSLGLPYLFPVGSSDGTLRYRPIKIKPTLNANVTYAARMANVNPTSEGYDINVKEQKISQVNPNFYHLIYRTNGTQSADLIFYYDPIEDGNVNDVAHWQNIPQWESIDAKADAPENNFNALKVEDWIDFNNHAFALTITDIICGDLFFPTIFSPNSDGLNDEQCVLGNCIQSARWAVYNRWGEKVFETEDKNACWDGTFKGNPLNTGVYVYKLTAVLLNGEIVNQKGNLTIVR